MEKRRLISRNVLVISLTAGLWAFGGRMRGPFFPLYVLALGGSYFQIGLIGSIGSIFMIVASFFGGYLSDTLGRKKIIYGMGFLISLDTLLYMISPSWEFLILASALNSLFVGLRAPSMTAIIADSTSVETRTRGFMADQVLRILAGSVSPIVVGLFVEKFGVIPAQRLAYACAFVTSMSATILRFLFLEETITKTSEEKKELGGILRETFSGFKSTINVLPREVWMLIGTSVIFTSGASLGASFFVTYAIDDVIGLSASEWGLVYSVMSIANVLSMVLVASFSDRFGRLKLILPAMFLTPLCVVGFVYCKSFVHVIIVLSALSILGSMMASPYKALVFDYSPKEHRGRIHAISNMISSLPGDNIIYQGPSRSIMNGMANMIGGIIYGRFRALPFYLEAVVIEISAIVGALFLRESKKRPKQLR